MPDDHERKTPTDTTRSFVSLLVEEAARGKEFAWKMLEAFGVKRGDHEPKPPKEKK